MFDVMLKIGKISLDIEALLRIAHHCDPHLCRGGSSCCKAYEVCFTQGEMERSAGLLPHCARFAPHLAPGGEFENPFEAMAGRRYAIDAQEDGACAFAFDDQQGVTWCSIHAAALELGLSPWRVKAQPCLLWPLALSEGPNPVLTLQDDTFDFPCNKPRHRKQTLDPGIAGCIARGLSPRFLETLSKVLARNAK